MKKYLICILIIFTFGLTNVKAQPIDDNCINNHTCMVLCNYVTKYEEGGSHSTGYQSQVRYRNITIYYNFEANNFTLKWQSTNTDANVYTKGPDTINYIFSTSGTNVYWAIDESPNKDTFVCPQNGYLDLSDLNGNNEVCFDNNGSSCKEYNSPGTSFNEKSKIISQEKDYDFEDQIIGYKNDIFGDIIDDISSGKFDVENDMYDKIQKDFKTNFLYNNNMPEFIANSKAYQSLLNDEELEKLYTETKEKALNDAQSKYEKGEITEEELEDINNNWNNDVDKVVENTKSSFENIKLNANINIDFEVINSCESYLGDPDNPDSPAHYLQFAFDIMKYIAIVLLFVLSIVDFVKAVASNDDKAIKKALTNAIKRLIIVIVIFFLPTLIKFILEILGIYGDCNIN